jgi:hypothetical protein
MVLEQQLKFISLLLLQIPSILCTTFILYHLLRNRVSRTTLHNHPIIAILATSLLTCLTDISMTLYYLYHGRSPTTSPFSCLLWNYIDLSVYALTSLFMAWASIERHIFIFHDHFLSTKSRLYKYHFSPLIIIPTYVCAFYFIVIFLNRCENYFDYNQIVCGNVCFYANPPIVGISDHLLHSVLPTVTIVCFNTSLFIRVLWQKQHRIRKPIKWQQHRRMVLQLFPVALLYTCGVIPYGSVFLAQLTGFSSETSQAALGHFFYLFYYMSALLPFVCIIGMPNLYSKIRRKTQVHSLQVTGGPQ